MHTHFINLVMIQGLVLMLLLAVITDFAGRKIPNSLVLFGLIFSLVCQVFLENGAGLIGWGIGVGAGFLCFAPLYLLRGMAAGDVKLLMAVGGFLGYPLIAKTAIITFLVGGVMALTYLVYINKIRFMYVYIKSKLTVVRMNESDAFPQLIKRKENGLGSMPYAPAIAIGTFVTLYQYAF